MPFRRCLTGVLVGTFLFLSAASAQEPPRAADLLPGSTAIYVEVEQPAVVIDQLWNHPAVDYFREQPEYRKIWAMPQMAAGMLGIQLLENQIGQPLLETAKTVTGGGLVIAFDPETEGAILLFRSEDEAVLRKLASTVLNFVSNQAGENAFQRRDYRDAKVAKFDQFLVARSGPWFLISSKPELARQVVDHLADGNPTPLSRQTWFVSAEEQRSPDAAVWAGIDLKTVRMAGLARELFAGRTDNPGAELILGGVLDALQKAPVAVAELRIGESIQLGLRTPFQKDWALAAREFFYGPELSGRAPDPLIPESLIASLTSYRDIGEWWLAKEELFDENVIAGLAQADSQLSTIFSGLDFGEEVLGALEPGVQIVVAENHWPAEVDPDVKLPAFALVSRMSDPEAMQRRFKIAFQSLIGFVNIQLGMQGQPQLDLETETEGGTRISSAEYMLDDPSSQKNALVFNFAPTIAFHEPWFIVSSNRELAVELAALAAAREAAGNGKATLDTNTSLRLEGAALQSILMRNRESLIANNMLEEGNSREEAEQAIGIALRAVEFVRQLQLDYRVESDSMRLELGVELESGDAAGKRGNR